MRIKTIVGLIVLAMPSFTTGQQIGRESYSYEVNKSQVYMYEIDKQEEKPDFSKKRLAERYLFNKVGEYTRNDAGQSILYYKFQLVPFKDKNLVADPVLWCQTYSQKKATGKNQNRKPESSYDCQECYRLLELEKQADTTKYKYYSDFENHCITKVEKKEDYIIDRDDLDKVFIVESSKFDKHEINNEVVKRYTRTPRPTYGSSFSVPFKFRRPVNDEPLRIAPSFTLGAYFGVKWRMHRYSPVYIVPTVTLGVTSIDINESTATGAEDAEVLDGQILARTASLGLIAQIDQFQIGVVIGWDKPGGEAGQNWVYNDRVWYSFQIGFDFLNLSGDSKDK